MEQKEGKAEYVQNQVRKQKFRSHQQRVSFCNPRKVCHVGESIIYYFNYRHLDEGNLLSVREMETVVVSLHDREIG